MIEIRDLNKGDLFLYNEVCYQVEGTENFFYAKSIQGYATIGILGISVLKSKLKVKLISRANENTNI
jgi:hypothetical protein